MGGYSLLFSCGQLNVEKEGGRKRERERGRDTHRSCQHKKVLGWLESAHHKNEKQVYIIFALHTPIFSTARSRCAKNYHICPAKMKLK